MLKNLGIAHVGTDVVGIIERTDRQTLFAQLVGVIGNHMNLVLIAPRQHVVVVIAVKMLDVAGIEVVDLAVVHKRRPRVRTARIYVGIGEERRAPILVRHKILCRQMVPKDRSAVRGIKRIVLVIDVVGIANLHQSVGVVEPAELGLNVKHKPLRIGGNASRRLILTSAPLLVA